MSEQRAEHAAPIVTEMEFRAKADGTSEFTAYAALFDTESDASWLPHTETIAPTAFANALGASGAHHTFVLDHDESRMFASTRSGKLRLSADSRGLLVNADLPDTTLSRDFRALHDAGETRGMSFQFLPNKGGEEWSKDRRARRLTSVKLGHVTAVTTLEPGFSATRATMQFRALADSLDADPGDLESLFDGIREGRALADTEATLLDRLAAHYRPEAEAGPPADPIAYWRQKITERT